MTFCNIMILFSQFGRSVLTGAVRLLTLTRTSYSPPPSTTRTHTLTSATGQCSHYRYHRSLSNHSLLGDSTPAYISILTFQKKNTLISQPPTLWIIEDPTRVLP